LTGSPNLSTLARHPCLRAQDNSAAQLASPAANVAAWPIKTRPRFARVMATFRRLKSSRKPTCNVAYNKRVGCLFHGKGVYQIEIDKRMSACRVGALLSAHWALTVMCEIAQVLYHVTGGIFGSHR
jgi:hypothetical protein